jgi:Xaa-Pro aminopeptidase
MFDFGGVVDGHCSDFGRTIYCGEPPGDYLEAYEVLLAAQETGRRAVAAVLPQRTRTRRVAARSRRRGSASTSATGWATGLA